MRKAYKVLAIILAVQVVIQGAMIAFAFAGVDKWVKDGHTLTPAILNEPPPDRPTFTGSIGFPIHSINGEMLIPLVAIALLVISFWAKIPRGTTMAASIVGLVALQVVLGVSHVPWAYPFHGLNAFLIFAAASMAAVFAGKAGKTVSTDA